MGRGIKFTKFAQKIKKQERIFGKSNPPSHPYSEIFREGNLDQAVEYMAFWKIEPAWGDPAGTGDSRLIYRSIPGSKGDVHVRNSVDDVELWSRGLGLLIGDKGELRRRVSFVQKLIRDKVSLNSKG